ncbi:MAG: hypothetical protein QHH15_07535 [Candidatus Thermoplasmatota archaeon]|jgi:hypothetical protein|nr:hypothetical protein [Candidatus Thermoplasmatota archaeon]
MKKILIFTFVILIIFSFLSISVSAHVPYFEHSDFTEDNSFIVRKIVSQSKAVYSWLEHIGTEPCEDIDVYKFKIIRPMKIYVELIVPVIDDYYKDFVPWFAVVGSGLPEPYQELPFELPDGYGAVVKENVKPDDPRETFYEFFGNKSYYKGPVFNEELNVTGTYFVYCWNPYKSGGDYTLVLGNLEIWGPLDIIRALIYTPLIRKGFELHIY